MILVDSNIPMYLVGSSARHKVDAQAHVERCLTAGERLVTDVEVLQEILHRYAAIGRRDAIQPAFDALLGIVDDVYAVEQVDTLRAKDIVMGWSKLTARDALHLAVMERRKIRKILSFDSDFDGFPGVTRIGG